MVVRMHDCCCLVGETDSLHLSPARAELWGHRVGSERITGRYCGTMPNTAAGPSHEEPDGQPFPPFLHSTWQWSGDQGPESTRYNTCGSVVKHSSPGKSRLQSACTIRHQVYARSLPPPGSGERPISAKGWKRCHALPPLGKKQRPRPMLQRTPNLCAERPWKRPSWPQPPDCE